MAFFRQNTENKCWHWVVCPSGNVSKQNKTINTGDELEITYKCIIMSLVLIAHHD